MRKIVPILVILTAAIIGHFYGHQSESLVCKLPQDKATALLKSDQLYHKRMLKLGSFFTRPVSFVNFWGEPGQIAYNFTDSLKAYDFYYTPPEPRRPKHYRFPLPSEEADQYFERVERWRRYVERRRERRLARYRSLEKFQNLTTEAKKPALADSSIARLIDSQNPDTLRMLKQKIVKYAHKFIGVPYRFGGESLNRGFDCSGFARYVFRAFGIELPRSSHLQSKIGTKVSVKQARPGDLIFFGYRRGNSYRTKHTGIVVSNNNGKLIVIHSARPGVQVQKILDIKYYKRRFLFIKRIIG